MSRHQQDRFDELCDLLYKLQRPPHFPELRPEIVERNETLHAAVVSNDVGTVTKMLVDGANPNWTVNGNSAYRLAQQHEQLRAIFVKQAIQAFDENRVELLFAFLVSGADVNEMLDKDANTPLHKSIMKKERALIIFILALGGDPLLKNGQNMNAYELFDSLMSDDYFLDEALEDHCQRIMDIVMDSTGWKKYDRTIKYTSRKPGSLTVETYRNASSKIRADVVRTHRNYKFVQVERRLLPIINHYHHHLTNAPFTTPLQTDVLQHDIADDHDQLHQYASLSYEVCESMLFIRDNNISFMWNRLKATLLAKKVIHHTDDISIDFLDGIQNETSSDTIKVGFRMPRSTKLTFENNEGLDGLRHEDGWESMLSKYTIESLIKVLFEPEAVKRDYAYVKFRLLKKDDFTPERIERVAEKIQNKMKGRKKTLYPFALPVYPTDAYHCYLMIVTSKFCIAYSTKDDEDAPEYAKSLYEKLRKTEDGKDRKWVFLKTPEQTSPYDCAVVCLLMMAYQLRGIEFTQERCDMEVPEFRRNCRKLLAETFKKPRKGQQ